MKYFLIALIIALSACTPSDQSKIDSVKNGIFGNYKSITVGQAFDQWQTCDHSQSKWSLIKTSNGADVVEFTCDVKDVDKLAAILKNNINQRHDDQIKSLDKNILDLEQQVQNADSDSSKSFFQEKLMENKDEYASDVQRINQESDQLQPTVNINKIIYTSQWLINKDDTFELSYYGIEYFWQDGAHIESKLKADQLDDVYQDKKPLFDIANSTYGFIFVTTLNSLYKEAK
ncbi:MAG: hypothetical protein QG673_780 [Pseudomonadota bacterium]|nr:hypothetical protein [Pseudomonadota bacterium]